MSWFRAGRCGAFPDGRILFQTVHKLMQHGKGFSPMSSRHHDVNGRLADRHVAEAMDDLNPETGMPAADLFDNIPDHLMGHGWIGFIGERGNLLSVLLATDDAGELDQSADAPYQVLRQVAARPNRLGGQFDLNLHGLSARDGRNQRNFVGIAEPFFRPGILAIPGQTHRATELGQPGAGRYQFPPNALSVEILPHVPLDLRLAGDIF